jgi:DNA modification methylase
LTTKKQLYWHRVFSTDLMEPIFKTDLGKLYHSKCEDLINSKVGQDLRGKVNLIMTSPPFPLNNKKSYGNTKGIEYKNWFTSLAPLFSELLTPDGSIVIEIGNAWEPERPVQSLLPLRCLLDFAEHPDAGLRLCQESICYNPARLPSPAQWVTIKRVRLTDSYTHVWWLAKSDNPKADNRRALRPYSASMERLLKRQSYNAGKRPSEHTLSETSFLTDHGGSISQNLFEVEPIHPGDEPRLPNAFRIANTRSGDPFSVACRNAGIVPHPARMPEGLVSFYTEFLTEPGDLVLDPFAGSCTTGAVAERLGRRWIGIEAQESYVQQSRLRFQ